MLTESEAREKFSDSFWYEIAIERHLRAMIRANKARYEVKMGHVFYTERIAHAPD